MKLQRTLILLVTSVSVASLSVSECINARDFEADAQTPAVNTIEQQQYNLLYVPTPQPVVDAMLQLAQVNSDDLIYDLGSGDGIIPITAAQRYGARGVGIDLNPERIQEANTNLQRSGVANNVEFCQQDLFETDLSKASVVTLYLLPEVMTKLRPKLLQELRPGTRILSHAFDMGDWEPQQVQQVDGRTIYLWVVPENVNNLRRGAGSQIIAFGDSITAGAGVGTRAAYPSVLSSTLGLPILNIGRGGDTTATALARLQQDDPTTTADESEEILGIDKEVFI
ncbi:MAG: methyltransferase domain-containing protein [Calothrix sp. FI2-JRJ7]|nr:methyltransferase domain-containing protein [Calothrix sp. FI2-JRJ7]